MDDATNQRIVYRAATSALVPAMAACRLADPAIHPADPRMAAYFDGLHHPGQALAPRTGFIAEIDGRLIGYVAGHLSTRHGCSGEVQYLFVEPARRRQGVAAALLRQMAAWFVAHEASRICVCLDPDSPSAQPFYAAMGAHELAPNRRLWYIWDNIRALSNS